MASEWTRPNRDGGAGPREDANVVGVRIDVGRQQEARSKRARGTCDCEPASTSEQSRPANKPAAQITMEAEVSDSLRQTPSRPPRSALGLDGVGAPRPRPAAPSSVGQSGLFASPIAGLRNWLSY